MCILFLFGTSVLIILANRQKIRKTLRSQKQLHGHNSRKEIEVHAAKG
uniref:Uncharacterized protein n=1 Tax=Rhizophora mucronata TaxID=61149 RepID=A0A2P2PWC8_RHIMU